MWSKVHSAERRAIEEESQNAKEEKFSERGGCSADICPGLVWLMSLTLNPPVIDQIKR